MKQTIHLFSILVLQATLIVSCKKDPAIEMDERLIGVWKHNIDANQTVYLQLNDDKFGYIERYENGEFKSDTQRRKWLIKKNKLYFGWISGKSEQFTIDTFPSVASSVIIHKLDTIQIGERYIILDNEYYQN
jgi:hypothetical protein